MIKLEQNRLTINLLGLKIRVRINDFINNEVYQIQENGKKKRIYFAPKGLKINLFGKNSKICIPEKGNFVNVIIFSNSNSNIQIDKIHEWGMKNLILEAGYGSSIHIKKNFSSEGGLITAFGVNKSITIGEDCMFSYNIHIRNHDMHAIFDKNTKEVLNYPKDVIVGNHCWMSKDSTILKGIKIPNNTIIGANAVITKNFSDENAIYAGNPAKMVKQNVNWDRRFMDIKDSGRG